MIYDLSSPLELAQYKEKSKFLISKGVKVELIQKRKKRSIRQNSYLHLILTWYGIETGYTLAEVKQDIWKREICRNIFKVEKKGRVVFRSSKDLDTKEMTIAIEKFRNHASSDLGIYLPDPNEQELIRQLEYEVQKTSNYIYS